MRLTLLPFLALTSYLPSALATPQIVSPAAGASIPAGPITVKWTDDGSSPSISQLKSYTLTLYVGGNSPGSNADSLVAVGPQSVAFSGTNSATGTIPATLSASLTNGFYLQMIGTAKDGGTVTVYSSRFTLTGMTGTSPAAIKTAVTGLGGSTAGPPGVNAVANAAAPAAPAAGVPAAGAGAYNVPYNEQTGSIKYAPMQGVPPQSISLNNFTPLFPTSAFTVATTWLPQPTIVTTMTESQTFSVQSQINTNAAQSMPTANADPTSVFLARWKD